MQIVCEKPTLNCYSYCYVKPSSYNLAVATATFVLQIAMLALIGTDSYTTVLDWISGEAIRNMHFKRWRRLRDGAPAPWQADTNAYKQRFWRHDRPRSEKNGGFGYARG